MERWSRSSDLMLLSFKVNWEAPSPEHGEEGSRQLIRDTEGFLDS